MSALPLSLSLSLSLSLASATSYSTYFQLLRNTIPKFKSFHRLVWKIDREWDTVNGITRLKEDFATTKKSVKISVSSSRMCELGTKNNTGKMLCYVVFIGLESCRWDRIKM